MGLPGQGPGGEHPRGDRCPERRAGWRAYRHHSAAVFVQDGGPQVQPGNCAQVQQGCRKAAGEDQPVQDRGSVTCSSRSGRSAVDYHVPSHWRLERAPGVAAEPRLFHFVELLSLLSPASELPALSARWSVCSRALAAHAWLLLLIFPLWYLLLEALGLNSATRLSWRAVIARTVRLQLFGLGALSALIFAFKLQTVSRLIIFGFCVLLVPISIATRWLFLSVLEAHRSHIYNIARILVIGTRERAREFIRQARQAEEGHFEVLGCFEPEAAQAPREVEGVRVVGSTEILRCYLFAHPVDIVVFAMPPERVPEAKDLMDAAMELGLRVAVLPDFYVQRLGYTVDQQQVRIDSFFGRPVAALSSVPRHSSYLLVKRVMDIAISALLLLLLAPLLALLAILVKLTSPHGPVFYRWKALGVNKKPFVSYKFRTMVPNAEELKPQILGRNEMVGPAFKMRDDPRS